MRIRVCVFHFLIFSILFSIPEFKTSIHDVSAHPSGSLEGFEERKYDVSSPVRKLSLEADTILAHVEVGKLGEVSRGGSSLITDVTESGEFNEDRKQEIAKELIEKQMVELVNLENSLHDNEVKVINFTLQEGDFLKKLAVLEVQKELKVKY